MRFGIIGTNFITKWFLEAAATVADFELAAVCSRTQERAHAYAREQGGCLAFGNLEELAACKEVDAVYIASPNGLHCRQALMMLRAGKHVLCEKPVASNGRELAEMLDAARENEVVLLEAMRPVFDPAFAVLRELLGRLGPIRRVNLVYNQYSSRYDKFKAGIVENAFNPALSNGALMDIGVYCVAVLVALFGAPQGICARCVKLGNGLDGQGAILAEYPGMLAELSYSKISQAVAPSVIQGEEGSLILEEVAVPGEMLLQMRSGEKERFSLVQHPNNMRCEIERFIDIAQNGGAEAYNEISRLTMQVLDEARRQQGIVFPAEL